MSQYLTKSKFKLGLECPSKIYYSSKPKIYANRKIDDPFLEALAKGGFQVGELATLYYPDGHMISEMDAEIAYKQTMELLEKENVVIFEAAIKYKNLFIRIDILEKKGNKLNLIEVKSKSIDPRSFEEELWDKRKLKKDIYLLKGGWKPYIYDVAYQAYVLKKAMPNCTINSFLMCADKTKKATVDGLNQKFLIKSENGRSKVEVKGDTSLSALGDEILYRAPLNDIVEIIHNNKETSEEFWGIGFEGAINKFSEALLKDKLIEAKVEASKCKACEFGCDQPGMENGFKECWKRALKVKDSDFDNKFVFDVWNFRGANKALDEGIIFAKDLNESHIAVNDNNKHGLTNAERQLLQVTKIKEKDDSVYLDVDGLREEMDKWKFPLHMIDFETCMVAIPFNKGQAPYQQIAFQFSHHVIHEDGKIEHANEYLNVKQGFHPNFEFVRELKKALGNTGSIFRYSNHENTVLCQIREQLISSKEKDKKELISFIETITNKKDGKDYLWLGDRNMIDLCEMVKKYYYSPVTEGSNSIKYVLPAILNESDFIKEKYSKKIYGRGGEICSKNFEPRSWISIDDKGNVVNPYHTLPPVFDQWDYESLELVMSDGDLVNGGAALTAYAIMQFTEMSDEEREKVSKALLRYCELDTFAMVLIWEHWNNQVSKSKHKIAV